MRTECINCGRDDMTLHAGAWCRDCFTGATQARMEKADESELASLRSQLAAALTSRKFKQCPTCGMDVYEDTMTNGACMECVEKKLATMTADAKQHDDFMHAIMSLAAQQPKPKVERTTEALLDWVKRARESERQLAAVTAERDAMNEGNNRTIILLDELKAAVIKRNQEFDAIKADRDAMKPVVEAAQARVNPPWRDCPCHEDNPCWDECSRVFIEGLQEALTKALDTYNARECGKESK